jgi:hypothetical protein
MMADNKDGTGGESANPFKTGGYEGVNEGSRVTETRGYTAKPTAKPATQQVALPAAPEGGSGVTQLNDSSGEK